MDILMKGPGEVMVSLIDRTGRTVAQQTFVVSGSERIQAKVSVPLVLGTKEGKLGVSPVLVRQSNRAQELTFDGSSPFDFITKRCKEIGCSRSATSDALKGIAKPLDLERIGAKGTVQLLPEPIE